MAFNVALYQPSGNVWAMTERGSKSLVRNARGLRIGNSGLSWSDGGLELEFKETALPWPGHRLLPRRFTGRIRLEPEFLHLKPFSLDAEGCHVWWPLVPQARIKVECDLLPGGGWEGEAYHDLNFGSRPLESDFTSWDWARGRAGDKKTIVLYDAKMRKGEQRTLGLVFSAGRDAETIELPPRTCLPRGAWGIRGNIHCDEAASPSRSRRLEDTPFYTRSLVETTLEGERLNMVHETLDCTRLANPFVRMMLPFRMPRNTRS
ncbi:carotenoid 1,2-hydratase [Roseibium sp. HPY-6]|uniref:carotenoid 1,2-hydratase n=1 Tax=Roseibium sp. HPY-6 TaxID=3229852 RepID=UPI00338D88DD